MALKYSKNVLFDPTESIRVLEAFSEIVLLVGVESFALIFQVSFVTKQ